MSSFWLLWGEHTLGRVGAAQAQVSEDGVTQSRVLSGGGEDEWLDSGCV